MHTERTPEVTWSLLRATKKGARKYIQNLFSSFEENTSKTFYVWGIPASRAYLKHNYRYLKYFLQWKSSKFCFFTISMVIAEKKEATTWTSSIKSRLSAFLPWLQVLFQIRVSEEGRAKGPLIKQECVPHLLKPSGKRGWQKHITLSQTSSGQI